jgi:hypothetical protein
VDWPTAPVAPNAAHTSCRCRSSSGSNACAGTANSARIAYELRREGLRVSASGVYRVLVRLGINRLRDPDPSTAE